MVMRRVSIEPNFQDLYLKFLDKVNLKPLNKEIVQATYENCKALLGSELIKSTVEERSLLKNLGCWLGKITIGKNKVLRAREIDLKALIIEAYEKGLMIAVIPFTSKILVPCSSSIAYGPPNPWTMGILGLLAEIYVMPNLKMNLKFEIEVLFKHLSVDLRDVTPTPLLKDIVREVEGNPDFLNKDVGSSQPPRMNEVKSGIISTINQVEIPLDVAASPHPASHSRIMSQYAAAVPHSSGTLTEDEKLVSLGYSDQLPSAQGLLQGQTQYAVNQFPVPAANIEHQVVVNKRLQAYGLHLHFQSVLPVAMDRAVKEIVSDIVQLSVSIATDTTKELVLKLENQLANEAKEVEIQLRTLLMLEICLLRLLVKKKLHEPPETKRFAEISFISHLVVEPGLHGTSREEFNVTELVDFDAAGFSEQYRYFSHIPLLKEVFGLFAEWYQICELPGANDVACARHVSLLQQRGLLKGDDMTDRFFRRIMVRSYSALTDINSSSCPSTQGQPLSFLAIDIYAKLVFSVLKFCPVDQGSRKLSLLPKVLALTVLTALANSFHAIQPLKVPGFSTSRNSKIEFEVKCFQGTKREGEEKATSRKGERELSSLKVNTRREKKKMEDEEVNIEELAANLSTYEEQLQQEWECIMEYKR
ncbi:hypothetical protein SASPL_109124 [Salvia splendens]|uniref:CCR4-NOT transcription complex subunit 1 n=1 Tax=Salvia splendens TaxID=180675 RepID=A0A8X8YGK2_SALSN|nr:hypothetical protein SASPL_109124 [Salvia splendens]